MYPSAPKFVVLWGLVLSFGSAVLAETIATVNRAITPGPEGNLGIFAAFGADHIKHFPRTGVEAAALV